MIYADLVESKSGEWGDSNGTYSYSKQDGLKSYYIKKATYNDGHFGEHPVIAPKSGTSGNDRFYVMRLKQYVNESEWQWDRWYHLDEWGNMKDYETSEDFGLGRENTERLIYYWINNPTAGSVSEDGSGSAVADWGYGDIWYQYSDEYEDGWFVPSRGEWSAFGDNLTITPDNYEDYGFENDYWSSSQDPDSLNEAFCIDFVNGRMRMEYLGSYLYIRLSTTF